MSIKKSKPGAVWHAATASTWTEVNLVRVNPQAKHIEGMDESWDKPGLDLSLVVDELKTMHAKGRGFP